MTHNLQPTISFIIPCYNADKYIAECLSSIYDQNGNCSNFEVICINDCSTDNTKQIILDLQQIHSTLALIDLSEKKATGTTRNIGLDAAKGEFIWFVDADDVIKPNILDHLLSLCKSEQLDELLFNYDVMRENSDDRIKDSSFRTTPIVQGCEFINTFFSGRLSDLSIVWRQIYRAAFIHQHQLRFPDLNIGEDSIFAWSSLIQATRVKAIETTGYTYRINPESTTSKLQQTPNIDILFEKSILFGNAIINLIRQSMPFDTAIINELLKNATWSINNISLIFTENYSPLEIRKFYHLCSAHSSILASLQTHFTKKSRRSIKMMQYGFYVWLIYFKTEQFRSKKKSQQCSS